MIIIYFLTITIFLDFTKNALNFKNTHYLMKLN